ncbi:MAG: hypothetical protein WC967_16400 [Balneolaceae bacterium]
MPKNIQNKYQATGIKANMAPKMPNISKAQAPPNTSFISRALYHTVNQKRIVPMKEFPVICRDALNKWGLDSQLDMMAEECAEFIVALNQYRRGRIPVEELLSEIADVSVMSDEMRVFFEIDAIKQEKIARLEKLLYSETADA